MPGVYHQECGLEMTHRTGSIEPEISARLVGPPSGEGSAGLRFGGDRAHFSGEAVLPGEEADLGGGLWTETGIGEADLAEGDPGHGVGAEEEAEVETKKINSREAFLKE